MSGQTEAAVKSDGYLGIFTLMALGILVGAWLWYRNISPLHPPQRFKVRFHEVAALNTNAAVYVNGVRVGVVENIDLKSKHSVIVSIRINPDVIVIPKGSKFKILNNNVIGAKYIDIDLPEPDPSIPHPIPLDENMELVGEDPGRPEIILDNLATTLSDVDFYALKAVVKRNLDYLSLASQNVARASEKFTPVADRTIDMEDKISDLAVELKGTTKRFNRIMDDPNISTNLKETVEKARETAVTIQATMHELNKTLADTSIRRDILDSLGRLNETAMYIQKTAASAESVIKDKELRGDVKEILGETRLTLKKVKELLDDPTLMTDLQHTLRRTRGALTNIDMVARRLNQVLDKRNPLLHLIFGRPGKLKIKSTDIRDTEKPAGADDVKSIPDAKEMEDGQSIPSIP